METATQTLHRLTSLEAGREWDAPVADPRVLQDLEVQVGPPPRGAPAVVVTGVPWRTGWKYRERGYRHVYWDAGTMLSQLLSVADSAGLTAWLHTRFPDVAVAALVGADGVQHARAAVGARRPGRCSRPGS